MDIKDTIIETIKNTNLSKQAEQQITSILEFENRFNDVDAFINTALAKYVDKDPKLLQIATQLFKNQINTFQLNTNNITEVMQNIIFNNILHFIENSIIMNIYGIQPMSGPVSLIYYLDVIRDKDNPSKISMQVLSSPVEATSKKFTTTFTTEVSQDLLACGMQIQDEISRALGNEITFEYETGLLSLLESKLTSNLILTSTDADLNNIVLGIMSEANKIAAKTRQTVGNLAVMSHDIFMRILNHRSFKISENGEYIHDLCLAKTPKFVNGLVGSIGTTNIYVYDNTINNVFKNKILVGYKSTSNETSAAAFFCPYVFTMSSGLVLSKTTYQPVMSLMSRYGTHFKNDISDYYSIIEIK